MRRLPRRFRAGANIDLAVADFLRSRRRDVVHAREIGLGRAPDHVVLRRATAERRVVLTHDPDFGRLAVVEGVPVFGIVFLRPGHIDPTFTIGTLSVVLATRIPGRGPFLLVARRRGARVTIRIRLIR